MKNTNSGNAKQSSTHRESTQGLKRKGEKGSEQHHDDTACQFRDERISSLDLSLSGVEMTSSYSNNDDLNKMTNSIILPNEKEFSSLIYMSKRINQETK